VTNLTEVLVIGLAVLSTIPLPILPLQILYLNLVTDVFPAFALAMGEGDSGILNGLTGHHLVARTVEDRGRQWNAEKPYRS
jgi:magnesium-transporting ATPase (P-type)